MAPMSLALPANICLYLLWLSLCFMSGKSDDHPEEYQHQAAYGYKPTPMPHVHSAAADDDDSDMMTSLYGLPGAQFEFRFEVGAGKQDCFTQKLRENAQLHVSFEVLRGADRNINMLILRENGEIFEQFEWTNEGNTDKVLDKSGMYTFCFDNRFSRFTSKVIYFYLLSYVEEDWRRYATDIQEYQGEVENFTNILEVVQQRVGKVLAFQAGSRGHVLNHFYLIRDNNSSVRTWSIIMCVIIIAASLFQVFFVRRLFNVHGMGVRSTSKPRA